MSKESAQTHQPPQFNEVVSYAYGFNGSKPHAVAQDLISGATYSYDPNGNMISDGIRTIVYNYDNLPKSITIGGGTASFIYDGKGERVKKISSGGTFIYVGRHYECTGSGVCVKYIFAGNTRIAQKVVGTGTLRYYHPDHLGSTSAVSGPGGNRIEDIQYFPFGEIRLDYGSVSMVNKYTSRELDPGTGLYYYGARYYNPALGKFISADPIVQNYSDPQALNRYSYVLNNPLNYIDPTGYGLRKWYKRNRDRIKAVVVIVATAVLTAECGGCGAASALKGALVGEAFGVYSAHRTGESYFTSVLKGGVSGAAIAGAFGGVNTLTKGMNPLIQIGSKGIVGGTASSMLGGKFETGFMYAAAAATLYWGYTAMAGETPNPLPGENDLPDGQYKPLPDGRVPGGAMHNVIGLNNGEHGFLSQQEWLSRVLNKIPYGNATAVVHDYWMNNFINNPVVAGVVSWLTIPPAIVVTSSALFTGTFSPLLMEWAVQDSH